MSVDSHILGSATVAGGTAATVAAAVHSDKVLVIGLVVALAVLIALGLLGRKLARRKK